MRQTMNTGRARRPQALHGVGFVLMENRRSNETGQPPKLPARSWRHLSIDLSRLEAEDEESVLCVFSTASTLQFRGRLTGRRRPTTSSRTLSEPIAIADLKVFSAPRQRIDLALVVCWLLCHKASHRKHTRRLLTRADLHSKTYKKNTGKE